ncbi:hypothetical protein LTR53_014477 [Teratosphaeriaceae sp. CCFEE 6253]|nr:hypothetical protein LTR53_014477 [Teratosphaeriaceae sp. CCFEE 6253]
MDPDPDPDPGADILTDYDNLFRIMYQHPPLLSALNIATAYTECKALLHLADLYDALEIVGSWVDHHLLRFGARLFKQIARYPPSYLKLGFLARSATIFTEAVIHVVGQWPLSAPQLRGQVDGGVMDLIEDKVDELLERQERCERQLWRLSLTTGRGGERVTPGKDYLAWLGWLAENLPALQSDAAPALVKAAGRVDSRVDVGRSSSGGTGTSSSSQGGNDLASRRTAAPPPAPPPPPDPARFYRTLGLPASSSTPGYLSHDDLKAFLKLHPELYTRENLRRLERKVGELKTLAREVVRGLGLVGSELELDSGGGGGEGGAGGGAGAGWGYLTCVRVEAGELPWED